MPSILSKNCIMEGEVEWYCLACSALLPAAEDTLHHIHTAEHKHNLTELAYADKYSDDYIRKGRGVYYCEVCNVTLPTAAKVGLHVTHATHVAAKTRRQLKRAGTAIVFQENTLITESAWNGLVDDTCVLCNVEFDDQSTHKSQLNHILNLINSSATTSTGNDVYRKIDDGFQCLTCNKVVSEDRITEHLDSTQHKSAFITYDQNQNEVNEIRNDDVVNNKSEDGDTTANTGSCNVDEKTLHANLELMKDKNEAACSDTTEIETLAKQHGLSMNKGEHVVYCSACSTQLTATLDRINEHVKGKKHKKLITKNIEKTSMKTFITNIIDIRDSFTHEWFVVINEAYFLHRNVFLGLRSVNNMLVCLFCDTDLTEESVIEHLDSPSHVKSIENCFVISSLKEEFIREFRKDLYHCGYCGSIENDLENMLDHLDTAEHKTCKANFVKKMQVFRSETAVQLEARRTKMMLDMLNATFNQKKRF